MEGLFTYCFYIFLYVLILYNTVFTYYSSKDQLKTLMPKEEGKKKKDERREMETRWRLQNMAKLCSGRKTS